jgi:molecular chaperone GrpE
VKYANEGLLIELLPIVDYFQYAFKGIPEVERNSNWLKGIEHIRTNFMKVLEEHDVQMISTVGEKFNPEMHESVEEVELEDKDAGTVIEEVAPGFTLHGKVIRSAKVKIAK